MKKNLLITYSSNRESLLDEITQSLAAGNDFVAAWLTGSVGSDEADEVSDLDLTVVVAEAASDKLCRRGRQVSATTTPERLELFNRFGKTALIHENNNNAPAGGTFTFVLYSGSAVMVDWVLVPLAKAARPEASRLLFDKAGIPLSPPVNPETQEERLERASELIAFFWMMAAITIKYAIRNDGVFVQNWLENLHGIVREIERLSEGNPPGYHRGSWTKPVPSRAEQVKAIRELCGRMEDLIPKVVALGAIVTKPPLEEIKVLLELAGE